jgi:hypothetical protein
MYTALSQFKEISNFTLHRMLWYPCSSSSLFSHQQPFLIAFFSTPFSFFACFSFSFPPPHSLSWNLMMMSSRRMSYLNCHLNHYLNLMRNYLSLKIPQAFSASLLWTQIERIQIKCNSDINQSIQNITSL